MRTKGAGGMLATGALVLLLGAPAAAQLAKQGTYSFACPHRACARLCPRSYAGAAG